MYCLGKYICGSLFDKVLIILENAVRVEHSLCFWNKEEMKVFRLRGSSMMHTSRKGGTHLNIYQRNSDRIGIDL